MQLHDRHALDSDVFAQDARFDGHPSARQLVDGLGVEDAHLPLRPPRVPVALEPKISDQPRLTTRHLPELLFGAGVAGHETRAHCPNGIGSGWCATEISRRQANPENGSCMLT